MKFCGPAAVVAVTLALTACAGEAPTGEDASRNAGDTQEAAASESVMRPGLYAVGDGTQIYARTRLNEDGTYTDFTESMEPVGGGTWEVRDDLMCFDPEGDGDDQKERCWTVAPPDENGVIVSSRVDSDETYAITPIEE